MSYKPTNQWNPVRQGVSNKLAKRSLSEFAKEINVKVQALSVAKRDDPNFPKAILQSKATSYYNLVDLKEWWRNKSKAKV